MKMEKLMMLVDELAQEIRRVDGDHIMGAALLAEALMPWLDDQIEAKLASLTDRLAAAEADLRDARYALGIHSGVKDGHEGIDGEVIERAIKAL